ncbi:MAG TPA: hypothetical protein VNE58_17045 [Casimicrobiaceae bacterium]|nr:hypothetical protein [Casimicrobiaceae bacterium]
MIDSRTFPSRKLRYAGIAAVLLIGVFATAWYRSTVPGVVPAREMPNVRAPVDNRPAIGNVESPASDAVAGTRIKLSGWALHATEIGGIEVRVADRRYPARIGIARQDVAQAHPTLPGKDDAGFEADIALSDIRFATGIDRQPIEIVALHRGGGETVIGTRSVISPDALTRWQPYATKTNAFHLLPALSGVYLGMAEGLDTAYTHYVSPTIRVGTRVPILYLRTTKGPANDYAFDPDFDIERRCTPGADARRLSDDSLSGVFRYAMAKRLPILFTLNGGIWADAACDMPAWDVNDVLEQDKMNCQWSEKNEVVADDHLKNLAGAFESPELARALTLNVYARDVRRYKKRNLQQAARLVARFAVEHPDLFVGVTLEPDLYMNPFFSETAWFDYNPNTLRQFREWLAGTGPYAGRPAPGVPDLSAYRRAQPLTLSDVSRLTGRSHARWSDVDPPRVFPRDGGRPFWEDPWTREWETFRRHLVDLHYDELSQWIAQAGVARDRIWSGQGFMAPHASAMPFAVRITSPVKNYDSGGMSVEGAKPAAGHLGAILYGPSAQNDIRMEEKRSLFATFAALDPRWAVGEYNSADLRHPKELPTYAIAYRGLREMWNHGARYVSPMAWPGSSGRDAGKPGYDPFTAWRHTPLEEAAKDFMLARAHLPVGSKLWTFGGAAHADTDGWAAERGTIDARPGHVLVTPDANGAVTMVSPAELMLDNQRRWRVVLVTDGAKPVDIKLSGRAASDAQWSPAGAGSTTEIALSNRDGGIDQLRIELRYEPATRPVLTRVAIIPDGDIATEAIRKGPPR